MNGGTDAAAALRAAGALLEAWTAGLPRAALPPRAAILLLSDGAFSHGGPGGRDDVHAAAAALASAGVALACGAAGRCYDAAAGGLRGVATAAGGLFVGLRTLDERAYWA